MTNLELPRQDAAKPHLLATITLSVAVLAIAFAPIFIRFSEMELSANATVFNRLTIFWVIFGLGKIIRQQVAPPQDLALPQDSSSPNPITRKEWVMLLSVGCISICSLGLWALSLQYTSIAKSMLLNNLTPIFTTLGGWLFLGQRFDRKFLIGMGIALTGAIALGIEDLQGTDGFLVGDLYALLSAVFLGSYLLVIEQLRDRFSATTILLWRCIVGSALLFPVVWFSSGSILPTTTPTWLAVLGLGIVCEGFGQRLLADSMDKLSSSFISLFLLLEPILSAILGWFIFLERISPITWMGFAVILSGIYLANSSSATLHKGLINLPMPEIE